MLGSVMLARQGTGIDKGRLDAVLLAGWPPERLERRYGWCCALDRGVTRRPNSIWPLDWTGKLPLEAAIADVEQLYRAAGLRPCFRISDTARPSKLDVVLAARGYQVEGPSHVLVTEGPIEAPTEATQPGLGIALFSAPSQAWLTGYLACHGADKPGQTEQAALRGLFERVDAPRAFGIAAIDGVPASVALAVVIDGWVQVSAVRTSPEWRRRGLADTVMASLLAWAGGQGAHGAALQVAADNQAALALYRKGGFRHAYGYHYRVKP